MTLIATKKPSCGLMKIRSQFCPRSASTWHSGAVRKLKIGVATVKQMTMPMRKSVTTHLISLLRSSV